MKTKLIFPKLRNIKITDVLTSLGKLTIVISILTTCVTFILSYKLNKQNIALNESKMISDAWQKINENKTGSFNNGRGYTIANLHNYGISLSNIQAQNMFINHKKLSSINFIRADIRGLVILNSDLSNANFSYSKIQATKRSNSEFVESNFSMTNFTSADLTRIKSIKNDFSGANFSRANLARMTDEESNFSKANFKDAKLCGAKFLGSDLSDIILSDNQPKSAKSWIRICKRHKLPAPCVNKDSTTTIKNLFPLCKIRK